MALVAGLALLSGGCRHCDDTTEEADAFVRDPANQTCTTDADCVVEMTGCAEMESAWCGQIGMNRTAQSSSEWHAIAEDLDRCAKGRCDHCAGLLLPKCTDGLCYSR